MLLDERLQQAFSLSLVCQLRASHAPILVCGFGILQALLPVGLSWAFAGILCHFVFARSLLRDRIKGLSYRRGQPEGEPGCDYGSKQSGHVIPSLLTLKSLGGGLE
jgi:hypothetical protein